jgi:hypothetical protein
MSIEEQGKPADSAENQIPEPVAEPTPVPVPAPEAEASKGFATKVTNPNVTQDFPHSKAVPEKDVGKVDFESANEHLSLLGGDAFDLNELIDNYPNINSNGDPKMRAWANELKLAQNSLMRGNPLAASLEREGSDWRQFVQHENEKLGASRPKYGDAGTVLTGERALLRVAAATGLGSIVQVPLWHTGIWMSFKAPPESAILELERRIANDKTTLGRLTNGMIYSNTSVFQTSYLLNFAFQYVFDTNAKELNIDYLKSIIKVTDIPMILWGLALAIYPNGYPYVQACCNTDGTCSHLLKEMLDLGKLVWTDNRSLTEWQRKRMTQRKQRMTDEDIKRYEQEHTRGGVKLVELTETVSMNLRTPVLQDYENSGFSWVNSIVEMMENAFQVPLKGQERDEYITNQGRLTTMRQYGHWVGEVLVPDAEISDDRETIEALAGLFSSDETLRDRFIEEIGKFIDGATISLVALPKHNCPACGFPQAPEKDKRHPHLIPMDVGRVFFSLLSQRITKVLTRTYL